MKGLASVLLASALAAGCLVLTGCGKTEDKGGVSPTSASQGSKQPTKPATTVTAQGQPKPGPTQSTGGDIEKTSAGWDDIPVYPGATQEADAEAATPPAAMKTDWQYMGTMGYVTDDPVTEVGDWYLEEMPQHGWMKTVHMPFGEDSVMSAWSKLDQKSGVLISVFVRRDDKRTYIGITKGHDLAS